MKALLIVLFSCLCAWGQAAAPPTPAQTARPRATLPDLPGDTVVAVFDDGFKMTMEQFTDMIAAMPPDQRQLILDNRQAYLHQYAVMRKLSLMAEKDGLDKKSPTKERLELQRMQLLAQTQLMMTMSTQTVPQSEIGGYYETNKERYKSVKVKALYVSFGSTALAAGGKKPLTEEQAKAKITGLLEQIRKGADFVKLVKENSDDETSRDKDGDFLTVRVNDNVPDAMRAAVFQLKQGEVSEPVRQPNGFYLFRAEEVSYRPLQDVRDEIFSALQQQHGGDWVKQIDQTTKVDLPNAAFVGGDSQPLTPAPAATPAKN
jgi:peptidyl-prolyl cis-trans isomerase C